MKRTVIAMVQLETDDPRVFPENIDVSTPAAAMSARQAVIDNLQRLTRLIALFSEDDARMMLTSYTEALLALKVGVVHRPPRDYVAPKDRH